MKVIILKDIKRIGRQGEVVDVKDGYARNYLIPGGLALVANKESMQRLENIKKTRILTEGKERDKSLEIKEKLENISVTITVEAKENDEIYGSVNDIQIAKVLEEEGLKFKHRQIKIDSPIKKLGVYTVRVQLHHDVEASLRVWIVKK